MPKPSYSKPASQLDLEARQDKNYRPPSQVAGSVDPGVSENGYVGTDPIYQNHANHTEAPYEGDPKSAEGKIDQHFLADEVDYSATDPEEGESSDESDDEPSGGNPSGAGGAATTPPSGGSTPPSRQS
jgi:hypothetical protein